MDIGDVRALEDDQDPEVREHLVSRVTKRLTAKEIISIVKVKAEDLEFNALAYAFISGLPVVSALNAPCVYCGYTHALDDPMDVESYGGLNEDWRAHMYDVWSIATCISCGKAHNLAWED